VRPNALVQPNPVVAVLNDYLSRYELLEEIGRGNMGIVYKARDPEIDRILAIKVVRLGFSLDDTQRKTFLERFRREAKIAGNLRHPHIVGVYDIDFSGDEPFIAMEYFPGIALSQLMERELPGVEEVRLIIRQLASALDYAHREGVVHRDIKPANVLYEPGPMIKLVDFGIAKVEALDLTATGEFIGTPSYMSPEIFSGERVDGRSDLFSLGVILYQLLTGTRPFEADTVSRTIYRVLHDEPAPPSARHPGLSPLWDMVLERLLEKKPADRYASAEALIEDLDSLERGTLVVHEPTQLIVSPARGRRRLRIAALAMSSFLVVVFVWLGLGSRSTSGPEPAASEREASFGALFAAAERELALGRLEESQALLNAVTAHRPDYPGSDTLSEQIGRARFRASLPLRFVTRHEHLVGHCTGDLLLREDGIVLESSRHGTWHWHIDELEQLDREDGETLTIRVASDVYHLTFIRPALTRADFERYQGVLEAARADSSAPD
jgi:serine/threonine protein kinase